jgi:hypothetical protein
MTNAINNLLLAIWPSNTSNEQLDLCALPGITAGIDETGITFGTTTLRADGGADSGGASTSAAFTSLSRSHVPRGVATSCREVQLHHDVPDANLAPNANPNPNPNQVQLHMTYLTLLGVAIAFTSLLFMPILPRQKVGLP